MCTAITYKARNAYFGRTLDYELSYGEEVVISPRKYNFKFRNSLGTDNHYAIIGMAHTVNDYPLYYDAINEKGLGIAGLNFTNNAVYKEVKLKNNNVAYFELIPYILGVCQSIADVKKELSTINITNTSFDESLPIAELHWLIADKKEAITVEMTANGLDIYDNPAGVLTNNPSFDKQIFSLNNYINLSRKNLKNNFSDKIKLCDYSRGMGAIGLPGDLSSQSRFVRASFVKSNSVTDLSEEESVNQFFHILASVEQVKGCCEVSDNTFEYTIYTSCCDCDKGIYYYTTYNNHQITGINMHNCNLNSEKLIKYPLINEEQFSILN